ncbi:MAG: hypothetical protein PVF18_08710 [Anaerolineales bacterium]|jgi:hypothetical protein
MNKTEAEEVLTEELNNFQAKSFEDLKKLIESPEVIERDGASGVSYQIEIQAFWDNPREGDGDLRIIASIDDGGFLSALIPLSSDFIIDPEGNIMLD